MYDKVVRLSIGRDYSRFEPISIKFSDLPKLLCAPGVMYSPTQYEHNTRKAANYKGFADFLVLDFDEGWSDYNEALFNNFIGYKVPTKSNMKEKNRIVCERYRILLLLGNQMTLSYKEHKRLYKHIIHDLKINSDTSCVDACRFYYSAEQPIENCVKLKGTKYFPWEKFNYKDLQYAPLSFEKEDLDISRYENLDVSYFDNLHHSKRYPCPLCQMEGLDQKGHHLGFNKDEDYPTCFYDEEHSKILRKIYKKYKYGEIENKIKDINEMVKERCTPDMIKIGRYNPKPTNYNDNTRKMYDKMLDALETEQNVGLDIETFSEYYIAETLEECEERLGATHKYIKGAYNAKVQELKGIALDPLRNKIRIITLGNSKAVCPFDMYYVTDEQKQRILNIIKNSLPVGHNLKFDIRSIMHKYGEEYCPSYCFDTMIASRMIHMAQDPEEQSIGHNLAATAFRFLGYKMNKDVDHTWGQDNLTTEQYAYAGNDVKLLLSIMNEQVRQFKELYGPFDTVNYDIEKLKFLGPLVEHHPILALEMQTLLEVIRIEQKGILPNIDMMKEKIAYYDDFIASVDEKLGINCGSSKQCVEFLQKYIDPSITSSSSAVLNQYFEDPRVHDIIYAKANRTRRGLMVSMSETNIHPYDGRIHAKFNQLLNTGRFSCSNPNMQQIPKDIKNSIYRSGPNGIIFDADYAAVELRLATVVSGDQKMLEAYKKNTDMHYLTASMIFDKKIPHTPEEKEDAEKNPKTEFINKWERGFGKMLNFGLIYGLHWTTFIAMNQGTGMSDEQLKEYYDKFFEKYQGIDRMIKNAQNTFMTGTDRTITRWVAFKNGSLHKIEKTVPFFTQCKTLLGRRLAVDTQNKLMNFPVQGSGADCIKLGICYMGYETRRNKTSYRTENLVHDDTIGESELQDFNYNSKVFRYALEFAINYTLRNQFYTPVNQDFCVLSMFGKEVFLEEALTIKDIRNKLIERMNHDYHKYNEADDEAKVQLKKSISTYNEVLKELDEKIKLNNLDIESTDLPSKV